MLLRHWSLFESIQSSTYTVSKLNLAKEPGQYKLKEFLVKIKCPIDEAKQEWTYMDPDIKSKLKSNI